MSSLAPHTCTPDDPWTVEKGRAVHPDAIYLKDVDYGDGIYCECYKCPNCGKYFEVELAQ